MTKKKTHVNKYLIGAILLIILAYPLYLLSNHLKGLGQEPNAIEDSTVVEKQSKDPLPVIAPKAPQIPAKATLVVPYTVQAPYGNWAVHEESCEEAAVLMYHQYLLGSKTDIPPASADREFRAMKAWQVRGYGKEPDLSIVRLGEFVKSYYNDTPRFITDLTEAKIKEEVAAGRPVLVPVMTQSLKNPHYSPGNVYHILLIKGYDATGVVTNDAGVKEGKNWHYTWPILWSAIDAQSAKMKQGRVGLVVTR